MKKIIFTLIMIFSLLQTISFVFAGYDGIYNAADMTLNKMYEGRGCAAVCADGHNGNRSCCSYDGYRVQCEDRDDVFGPGTNTNGVFISSRVVNTTCGTTNPAPSCNDEACENITYSTPSVNLGYTGCYGNIPGELKINDNNYKVFLTSGSNVKVTGIGNK
jgi:hypothetical protein